MVDYIVHENQQNGEGRVYLLRGSFDLENIYFWTWSLTGSINNNTGVKIYILGIHGVAFFFYIDFTPINFVKFYRS